MCRQGDQQMDAGKGRHTYLAALPNKGFDSLRHMTATAYSTSYSLRKPATFLPHVTSIIGIKVPRAGMYSF